MRIGDLRSKTANQKCLVHHKLLQTVYITDKRFEPVYAVCVSAEKFIDMLQIN